MQIDPSSLPLLSTEGELHSIGIACRALLRCIEQEAVKVGKRKYSLANGDRIQVLWEGYAQSKLPVQRLLDLSIEEARALQAYLGRVLEP